MPYPPAPNVPVPAPAPARDRHRRDEPTSHDDGPSVHSYFRLVTDSERRSLPALTPNFAPALHVEHRRSGPVLRRHGLARTHTIRRPGNRSPVADGPVPADADEDSNDNAVGFPPLRRMGRRTIADGPLPSSSLRESWSPATTLDGLGDRERSMSPVDDHWETMLSSVAPDPLAPTAESSFASAAASASFSNSHPSSRAGSSNSASSSRTHLTIPSRRQSWSADFLRACDTSEDDSASDTEAEDDILESTSMRRRATGRTASNEPPPRDPHYSRAIRERSRESAGFVRSFYGEIPFEHARRMEEQLAVEERATPDEEMPLDQELRDARALLERLARREDVSDDFWASVGLRRPVADRVERIQQRERL